MHEDLLDQTVIGCDETPVQVLDEPSRAPEKKSYMWVCASLANVNIILFHYHMQRNVKTAATVLASYQGILVCDGLKSYDAYASSAKTMLAGCMAHLRRAFYKAEKAAKKAAPSSPAKATEVLRIIKKLYKIEEEIKSLSSAQRLANRQERSRPLLEAMKACLDEQHHKVLPKSLLGKAIRYARDQWPKMLVFLDHSDVPIDNNRVEGYIRPFVIGRNNWLFSQSQDGAHASAALYSLIESAKANHLDPFAYLNLIFNELAKASTLTEYERLLPYHINKHFDVQPYRQPK